jgi:hypothetical protein
MRAFIRPLVAASRVSALPLALLLGAGAIAVAQPKPAAPVTQAEPAEASAPEQMPLTEKQVENLLAAQKEMAAATAKLPEQQSDKPDPKSQAELDGIAKKHGFADYAEYDKVAANIGLVMVGFDPQTKAYVGPEAAIKKQIASLEADKEVPPLDKKKALEALQESVKTVTPVKYPDNIKLVGKYYDKLSEAMQED